MTDLRSAKRSLLDLEERLLCRLTGRPPAERGGDLGDQARVSYEQETGAIHADRVRGRLVDIRAALLRIEQGTYGLCADCDERIGKARLEAWPEAARCVPCQTDEERRVSLRARSSGAAADEDE